MTIKSKQIIRRLIAEKIKFLEIFQVMYFQNEKEEIRKHLVALDEFNKLVK
jgi:hypothetical protein